MSNCVDLELPEQLTVANVQNLHEKLEAIVDDKKNDAILVNASSVTRADTAGLQLLYAMVVAAKERQITLQWKTPSDVLLNAAGTLGLTQHLGIN